MPIMVQEKIVIDTFTATRGAALWSYRAEGKVTGFTVTLGGIPEDFLVDVLRFHLQGDTLSLVYGGYEVLSVMGRAYIDYQTEEGETRICLYLKLR